VIRPRGHDVAVLWSRRSRDAYAALAISRGETYRFTDAWGRPRTWLKGEHAYLAPAGAAVLLHRCNLKHDLVEEDDLTADRLGGIRALLVPNAGTSPTRPRPASSRGSTAAITAWSSPAGRTCRRRCSASPATHCAR
jgi:hypothetical protein